MVWRALPVLGFLLLLSPALALTATEGDLTRVSASPGAEGSPSWSGPSTLVYVTPSGLARVDVAAAGAKTPRTFQGRTWVFDPSGLDSATVPLRAYSPTQGALEPPAEVAALPGVDGVAAISRHRSVSPDLWVVRSDGTARPLYTEPTVESSPAWEPGGGSIWVASQGRLLRVDAATGAAAEVKAAVLETSIVEYRDPAPSPDGSLVAFVGRAAGETSLDLWLMEKGGQNPRRLTHSPQAEGRPSWFPDGKRLAVQVDSGLALVNADGSGFEAVTTRPDLGRMVRPAVSPDGTSIAFVSRFGGSDDIWLLKLPGAPSPSPTPAPTPAQTPSPPEPSPTPKQPGFEAAPALAALAALALLGRFRGLKLTPPPSRAPAGPSGGAPGSAGPPAGG